MLTINKIKIHKEYGGDIDMFVRHKNKSWPDQFLDEDWGLIASLTQDILLMKRGHASQSYIDNLNQRLQESCDNQKTIDELMKLDKFLK